MTELVSYVTSTLFSSHDSTEQDFSEGGSDSLMYTLVQALDLTPWPHWGELLQMTHRKVKFLGRRVCNFSILLGTIKLLSRGLAPTYLSIISEKSHFFPLFPFLPTLYLNTFITVSLSYNSQTMQSTHLNDTSQRFLVCSQSRTPPITILEHFRHHFPNPAPYSFAITTSPPTFPSPHP